MRDGSSPAEDTRGDHIDIWQMSRRPTRPYDEVQRRHVVANESILGGDALPRSISKLVREANADGAIILANSSHTEANNTNRHIYTTVVHEADIVIIRYR